MKLAGLLLVIIGLFLLGCSSGPTDEEIAASVKAQVAIALTEATPTYTPTPKASATQVPTNTPRRIW